MHARTHTFNGYSPERQIDLQKIDRGPTGGNLKSGFAQMPIIKYNRLRVSLSIWEFRGGLKSKILERKFDLDFKSFPSCSPGFVTAVS